MEKHLESAKLKGIRLPRDIQFEETSDGAITLRLPPDIDSKNMQEDSAAFEAWALVCRAHGYASVRLSAPIIKDSSGHYNRFLYRALRFSQYFEWFSLSTILARAVYDFESNVLGGELVVNVPDKEADAPQGNEARNEEYFSKHTDEMNALMGICADNYYRQLPVGLFAGKKSDETRIFTGGKSAIDLWARTGDAVHVIELKAGDNKSLGVLSELFFYACFVHDAYKSRLAVPGGASNTRGYEELTAPGIEKICAYVLTEQKHPQLDKAFDELRKCRNSAIVFEKVATYKLDI